MTHDHYRKLLLIYFATTVAAVAATMFAAPSEALRTALEKEPDTGLWSGGLALAVYSLLTIAWLVGLVGLFRFQHWGRSLSLYSTLAGVIVELLAGPSLYSGPEGALYEAAAIAWGAILALSYFSPVSSSFQRHHWNVSA